MTPGERATLHELLRLMFAYTVAIVGNPDTKHLGEVQNAAKVGFGTGVRFRVKNRLFILTAKHCINPDDRERPIHSVLIAETFDRISLPCNPTRIIARHIHPSRDIGYLEIEDDGDGAASIGNITDQEPTCEPIATPAGDTIRLYTFVGHPLYDGDQSAVLDYMASRSRSLIVGPPPKLIKRSIMLPCREGGEDVFRFDYPSGETYEISPSGELLIPSVLPTTAVGFSGGGVWNGRHTDTTDQVILPDRMVRLFAIQSRQYSATDHRSLGAIPVRHCLRMMFDRYPDLQDELRAVLPD